MKKLVVSTFTALIIGIFSAPSTNAMAFSNNASPDDELAQSTVAITTLRNSISRPFCTGTLIDPQWVMSANHCFGNDTTGKK